MSTPADLRYTAAHEWVRVIGDHVRIGVTDFAQESLGDIVFVTLPAVGTTVAAGQSFGEVESTKSVSDLFAPLGGVVVARNEELDAHPELVNSDPYGEGWMVDIAPTGGVLGALAAANLLDAAAYQALIGS
ncbi:MAG TPA: glycine cleavage system protein GcvH [Mycobacteriales bacterium]|nr:glycine cleavage system protein GcvH [Mycobacteriales bacterium]